MRKQFEQPSELGTSDYSANVWKRIREQNQRREREENPPQRPQVAETPRAWMCRTLLMMVTFWMFFHA